ncbi:MAG: SDR family NAD(P)-dependent oxidoreductase [Patescibacteria group bacterium]|jgi:NAD(P)-dependent dehydrogenase (short-subunit alcohol dehydrogenase family)
MRLQKKVAVVTGASSGLGKAIAEMFSKEGARVVFSDINAYPGKLPAGALFLKADTSKDADVKKLVNFAVAKLGRLDIMVNNAGIGLTGEIVGMPDKVWNKVLAVNLNGVFYSLRAAATYMKNKKIKGSIINMASILGQVGFRSAGAYSAAKGGVNQLTRTGSLELAPFGIRVNSIAPGFIETGMTKGIKNDKAASAGINAATPLGHMGEPDDIAYAAVYLASDEAKFVTGSVMYVDGGWTAQ